MDSGFIKALLSAISSGTNTYCIVSQNSTVHLYSKPLKTFTDLEDIPTDSFVTGWQDFNGLHGQWTEWEKSEIFNNQIKNSEYFSLTLPSQISWKSTVDEPTYLSLIKTMQKEMNEGKYFLANLTRKISTDDMVDPALLAINSAIYHDCPHRFFYHSKELSILGLSPERFCKIDEGNIVVEPMKGTDTKSKTLVKNKKELQENIMMIDLSRSELSKICDPSTIKVTEQKKISNHPGLIQMSSVLTGTLDITDVRKAVKAIMPVASVTGTPKPFVLERLNDLENFDRGTYCGVYGQIDTKNNYCDLSVAIRTIEIEEDKTSIGVGAGITVQSEPEKEWNETELKLKNLINLCDISSQKQNGPVFTSIGVNTEKKLFAFETHLERLERHCKLSGISFDRQNIVSKVSQYLSSHEFESYQKLRIKIDKNTDVIVSSQTIPESNSPFTLGISWTLKPRAKEVIKTVARNFYEAAFLTAQLFSKDRIDDAILLDGINVCETTRTNIFCRYGDKVITPNLNTSLRGVFQERILNSPWEFKFEEKVISIHDLLRADEIVLTNSVRGAIQVEAVHNELLDANKVWTLTDDALYKVLTRQFEASFDFLNE